MFHILTACSRPENLPALAESIKEAQGEWPNIEIQWHIAFDPYQAHVGGQALKNRLLDGIQSGWCYILDDDSVLSPAVLAAFFDAVPARALVLSQRRSPGQILWAEPGNMKPGSVDIGQVLLRRDLIGGQRLPLAYDGDGQFIQALFQTHPDDFSFLPGAFVKYNALQWPDDPLPCYND